MNSLTADFFTDNRERIYDKLRGGILVIPAYSEMQRGNDAAFKFEQEANFWYATGIEYPDWWVVLDGSKRQAWLTMPEVSDVHALFDGSLSADAAATASGIRDVVTPTEARDRLKLLSRTHRVVYTIDSPPGREYFGFALNPAAREMRDLLSRRFAKVEDFRLEMARIRAIKSPTEISALQQAINTTIKAFEVVRGNIADFKYEYEIEAQFSYEFRRKGAAGHAYDPIVAAGGNACTLHYGRNQDHLRKGSLVLLDVGARVNGYAADITRTYSYGEPTRRQKQVHEAVLWAHEEIITLLEPGLSIQEYHDLVDVIMQKTLIELGLMKNVDDIDKYRKYFPHAISHGLGVDVHDALGQPLELAEGMVLTVEPGVYIPEEKIGVRIEDDLLITSNGHRNLSGKLSTGL